PAHVRLRAGPPGLVPRRGEAGVGQAPALELPAGFQASGAVPVPDRRVGVPAEAMAVARRIKHPAGPRRQVAACRVDCRPDPRAGPGPLPGPDPGPGRCGRAAGIGSPEGATMTAEKNRQILLAARPHGEPTLGDFRLVEAEVPEPGPGQMLLRTIYL